MKLKRLVYDIGMHDGSDTDFYLRKGFDVVAVEPNPHYVARARQRFADEIAAGRLVILDVALTDEPGEVPFFVHEHDDWSRLDVNLDHRFADGTYREIKVRGMPFTEIARANRTPYYVKLDIEGPERRVLAQMFAAGKRPPYLSFEANSETELILDLLERHGYREFQVLGQKDKSWIRLPEPPREGAFVDAKFNGLMSGPFGRELPGRWTSAADVRVALAGHYRKAAQGDETTIGEWHDVHARLGAVARLRHGIADQLRAMTRA